MAINYSKNRETGGWRLKGPAAALKAGTTVTVTKRDGSTAEVYVASVGEPFADDDGQSVFAEIGTAPLPPGTMILNRGYDHHPGELAGLTFRTKQRDVGVPAIVTVISATFQWIAEDGMSFGLNDDQGYAGRLICRPATPEEAAKLEADEAEKKARGKAHDRRLELACTIMQPSNYVDPIAGHSVDLTSAELILYADRDVILYGGGSWFAITADAIWFIHNNGADGDDWVRNNVRTGGAGALGWRVSKTVELEAEVRRLDSIIGEKPEA